MPFPIFILVLSVGLALGAAKVFQVLNGRRADVCGLLLDQRNASYLDATQAPDATIYAIFDHARDADKGIFMSVFTAGSILLGQFSSPSARSQVLVNQVTSEYPAIGRTGKGSEPQVDESAAAPISVQSCGLKFMAGKIRSVLGPANYVFSDRGYIAYRLKPRLIRIVPSIKEFIFSSIGQT